MVYVYAVSEPIRDPLVGQGLGGAALRVVSSEKLAAVASDDATAQPRICESDLWVHERVVEELMLDRAVLPMRFGSVTRNDDAVRRILIARQEEFIVALRRVRDAVEIGVRAALQPDATKDAEREVAAPGPGTAYLMRRAGTDRPARALVERLDRSLTGLYRSRVQRRPAFPGQTISAAYLVDRSAVDAFCAQVAALDAQIEDAQIVCTGPWPPYSFTGALAS